MIVSLKFSLIILLEGLFSAYFGRGKSRTLGIFLILIGIILSGGFFLIAGPMNIVDIPVLELAIQGILYISSALIASVIALAIFLVLVVRT